MILIEITDEAGISHYEILDTRSEELTALEAKALKVKVGNLAKNARRPYSKAAQKGDKEASEKLALINLAEEILKDREKLNKYDEELASGKGVTLEVLRVQPIAPPFFWDRTARFKVIEHLMQEAGLTGSLST